MDWTEFVQTMCRDPVVAVSMFKPNAPGSWELASFAALADRQLLKASASYFAERVLVVVTSVEVVAVDAGIGGMIRPHRRCWPRDDMVVFEMTNRDG